MEITVLAPAKVNLTLDVTSRLPNGYHTVEMVMQTISLYDEIHIRPDSSFSFTVEGAELPLDRNNTICKAAKLYTEQTGLSADFAIRVKKNIPMQAGLAGGSADAAGVLVGLNRFYGYPLTNETLLDFGAQIGADVPFAIQGGTCVAAGIGTTLHTCPAMPFCYVVVAKPACSVSTAQAYTTIDSMPYPEIIRTHQMKQALQNGDITQVAHSLYNRFEEVLQIPEVETLKKVLCDNGALGAVMTGSGSAVFGLFTDEQTARKAEKAVEPYCVMCGVYQPIETGPQIV
jgi:4-diphosphocytidyl-2-C-methyl-D-erythritol kinase